MDWEEAKEKMAKAAAVGDNLDKLSVAELEARIAAFEAEIGRVRAEIAKKKAHNAAAESLFKR
jgi:uncharacterized small protein (DUF1192 family)